MITYWLPVKVLHPTPLLTFKRSLLYDRRTDLFRSGLGGTVGGGDNQPGGGCGAICGGGGRENRARTGGGGGGLEAEGAGVLCGPLEDGGGAKGLLSACPGLTLPSPPPPSLLIESNSKSFIPATKINL